MGQCLSKKNQKKEVIKEENSKAPIPQKKQNQDSDDSELYSDSDSEGSEGSENSDSSEESSQQLKENRKDLFLKPLNAEQKEEQEKEKQLQSQNQDEMNKNVIQEVNQIDQEKATPKYTFENQLGAQNQAENNSQEVMLNIKQIQNLNNDNQQKLGMSATDVKEQNSSGQNMQKAEGKQSMAVQEEKNGRKSQDQNTKKRDTINYKELKLKSENEKNQQNSENEVQQESPFVAPKMQQILIKSLKSKGHEDFLKQLTKLKIDLKTPFNNQKFTLLHLACNFRNKQLVSHLLSQGLDVNAQEEVNKYTPLMIAAVNGDHEMCQSLIEGGADKSLKDGDQQTAFDLASRIYRQDQQLKDLLRPKISFMFQ